MNYYNDNEPFAAQWLRNLIEAGHIGEGTVDERSIADVKPKDLDGFSRCHFFAGIAGWELALRLAGWSSASDVWTGSCPCQPLSCAGKRAGEADKRHLWPVWQRLIEKCRPPVIFGEQVASADGREWLAGVRLDLESMGYAVGAADMCAAGFAAPHIRQRLFWVADAEYHGSSAVKQSGDTKDQRWMQQSERCRSDGRLGNAEFSRSNRDNGRRTKHKSEIPNPWDDSEWLPCSDGKYRRTQSGIRPLAPRLPDRVGQLRAYGNSIVPQVAAEFIRAFMEGQL
jgi:DNA (cytosine-5)-methyltransferase 1